MGYNLKMRLWRGDQSGGDLEDYEVEVSEGEVVLDAIHRVQATQAGDLAVRWNCKAGKCGSCSAEINGKPRLMCMCRLSDFDETETITVTPLRAFPVVRDLVTDVSYNYQKAAELPSFSPPPRDADNKRRMAQIDVERGQEFRKCIECFLCQTVCHVVRDHEDNKQAFAGPRFFLRYAELDMHPLDTNDRRELAQGAAGIGMCNITKCCTEVCPEGIKITDNAIIPMKERVVDKKYDPLVWLGATIGLRNKDDDGRRSLPARGNGSAPAVIRPRPEPGEPVASVRPRRLSPYAAGLAKASLVLGILSILTLNAVFGVGAIGLGRAAQAGSVGADAEIHRRARTGVLAGSVGTLLSLLAAAVLIVVYVAAAD